MNLALCHCWKEWRAQRAVLVAYSLLVFVSLCLGFLLVPEHWWQTDGKRALSLSWFVAAGVIGVFAFAAPQLVRAEFAAKEDQFVRRLPGALGPSFTGKLLFLLLAAMALPLVGLLWGELFLQAIGQEWDDLFRWRHDGEVAFEWPWPTSACIVGLLLAPWVWALGTWLPGGRMAVGGSVLLVLVIGLGVVAVLRQSPSIENHLHWEPWLWAVVPLALAVAGVSWVKGRRGGGALRSARFGMATMAVGLLPPAVWLGHEAWDYHHPDLQRLERIEVQGITPDARFVLADGAAHSDWCLVHLRIDLETGAAAQIAGINRAFTGEFMRVHPWALLGERRYWRSFGESLSTASVLDLCTGSYAPIGHDAKYEPLLSPELRAEVLAEVRATTKLRAPNGRRVWFEDSDLCCEEADGSVSRQPWPKTGYQCLWPAGHGFQVLGDEGGLFDLTSRQWLAKATQLEGAFFVRGVLLFRSKGGPWQQQDIGGAPRPCGPLANCTVLGLLDDNQLLCAQTSTKLRPAHLFLFRPADGAVRELALPDAVPFQSVAAEAPMHEIGSLLARNPAGHIWLRCSEGNREVFLLVDAGTLAMSQHTCLARGSATKLLAWPDEHSALVKQNAEILRIDLATGSRTVLFPRHD